MFQGELDNSEKIPAHLDKRAYWNHHKQEYITNLFVITDRCLDVCRKKCPEIVELIPEVEEVNHPG